jgi:acetyl esterase/lipase
VRVTIAPPDPPTSGLLHALSLLARPARFEALEPTHRGVKYTTATRRGVAPLCDVYLPAGSGPHASVVVVHGGGFVIGHRRMKPVRLMATRLCRAGFAVCSVDYRLLLRGGGLDAQVEDVTAAAAFWRAEHARFGCDPSRISMLGFSAGASLMLLHAGKSEHAYHRLVSIYGAVDFEQMSGRRAELLLGLILGTRDRRVWKEKSPSTHATMRSPLLTVHGTHDDLVPVGHATRLHETRRARGLPSEIELVHGMRHGWLNDASLPETELAISRVLAFLRD